MANLNKPRKSASKKKGKISVHQKVEVRSKSKESGKNDTLPPTPMPHSQGAVMKVKIKKK